MKKVYLILLIGILSIFTGCSTYRVTPISDGGQYKEYFDAKIELTRYRTQNAKPIPELYRKTNTALGFILTINNKTNKKLEINWNKTLFIKGDQTNGSFIYNGQLCVDRNREKIPDIIFEKSSFKKVIFPSFGITGNGKGGCYSTPMGIGKLGMLLNIIIDGQEFQKKLLLNVVKEKKK